MRQLFLMLFLVILPLIISIKINGDEKSKNTNSVLKREYSKSTSTTRPKAPSNQFIVMSYDAEQGICTFELPEDVTFITVEFTETETDWTVTETALATDPVIHVTLMPATYTVTCTTDNGSVYRGEFSTTKF